MTRANSVAGKRKNYSAEFKAKVALEAKVERVHHRVYATRDEARRDLFAYIEGFYNSRRLHSGIGYRSSADMGRMAA